VESGVAYLLINSKMAQWMGRSTTAMLVHGECWGRQKNYDGCGRFGFKGWLDATGGRTRSFL
jgi:hypothetical protein